MRKPVLAKPSDIDPSATTIKKKFWEKLFKCFIDKEERLEENMKKLYMLLLGQCSEVMQAELKSLPNYDTLTTAYNSIALLKAIT